MKKKILIVEDDAHIRKLYHMLLTESFDIIEAENGKQAVDMATAHFPDIVIMDIMMPVMDGLEALTRLKKEPGTATIPVILLTAKVGYHDLLKGYNVGADYYITKPFKSADLMDGVNICLANAGHPTEQKTTR